MKCFIELSTQTDSNRAINLIFEDTGEIRQKIVSAQWLFERLWMYEYKTWKRNGEESIDVDSCTLIERNERGRT